ncbi:MAG: FtsK/SpoIIIE domain-containing protein [Thermotaleaceae bacterium]
MAKKQASITEQIIDFFTKVLFTAIFTGIASTIFLRTSLVEKYPEVTVYAIEGKKLGFGISGLIILVYVVWTKKELILKTAMALVATLTVLFFKFVKKLIKKLNINFIKINEKNEDSEEKKEKTVDKKVFELEGYPSSEILPIQPKIKIENTGEKIAQMLPAALKKIGTKEEIIEDIKITNVSNGPASALIEIELPDGFTQSQMESTTRNLKAALGVPSLQIIEGSAAGRSGLIVGHEKQAPVYLRSLIETKEFKNAVKKMILPIPVGIDVMGNIVFEDLTKFPHALVAGSTNSGKSVWLNQVIACLAFCKSPKEMQFILVDPKKVEFPMFENLPHVARIETDPQKAVERLNNLVEEMDRRYALFQKARTKNIAGYNEKVKTEEKLPYIVEIVDEFNDLMMVAGASVIEPLIIRLAQLARGAGIHLIIATQRPSVDVITGVIKGNLPTRICFSLKSQSDYSTVFGNQSGINFHLRGRGDGIASIEGRLDGFLRFQGAAVSLNESEEEATIKAIGEYWRSREAEFKKDIEGVMNIENTSIITPPEEETVYRKEVYTGKKLIRLYEEDDDATEPLQQDDVEEASKEDREALEYEVALKIIEQIDNTPDDEEVYISARKIRNDLRKDTNKIKDIMEVFAMKGYVEAVKGRGFKVLNEEIFYRVCDAFEEKKEDIG